MEKATFQTMKNSSENKCYDTIHTQTLELLASRNHSLKKSILNSGLVEQYLIENNETLETCGVWVYYP